MEMFHCGKYHKVPNAWGYCLTQHAERLGSPADVEQVCSLAGEWEGECRRAWVSGHRSEASGYSTDALLAACGGSPDCAFELVDFRPEADVARQLDRCAAVAGPFSNDCVIHALERWWRARPDNGEVARVANLDSIYSQQIGYYVGAAVACQGTGVCLGTAAVTEACSRTVEQLRGDLQRCPSEVLERRQDPSSGR